MSTAAIVPTQEWADSPAWRVDCPVCADTYTHHGGVEVFERPHEDGPTHRLVPASCERVCTQENPSPRRNAVRGAFHCESRDHRFYVDIIQHKGQTFLFVEPVHLDGALDDMAPWEAAKRRQAELGTMLG